MNLFGKILIMLNLLMSLVFMGFAVAVYSAHKNWKEVITLDKAAAQSANKPLGLQYQLTNLQDEKKKLEEQVLALQKEMKQELAMRNARLQVLETAKEELAKQVVQKEQEIQTITEDKNKTSAAIAALTDASGKKSAEIATLADEIEKKRGEVQDLFRDVLERTDQLAQAQADLDKAKKQNDTLARSVADMRKALEKLGVDNIAMVSRIAAPAPKLEGYVRAATPEGLVEVSLGSDDGLMRGHTMEVFRQGATANASKYLGRIEILSTKADVSVGKVLPEYRRGNIEKDDRVATRFN